MEEKARLMNFSKILIVCNRGDLDGKAYAGEEAFSRILKKRIFWRKACKTATTPFSIS